MDKTNNRICNLREADRFQNAWNCRAKITSKTGIKGVRLIKSGNYQARIMIEGKVSIKTFGSKDSCIDWLSDIRKKYHGEFSRD